MLDAITTEIFAANADATVEARCFLARVKPRTLKTDTGRVVTTEDLAKSLVRRADLEHAVVKGARPKTVLCRDCKALIEVSRSGHIPVLCATCRPKRGIAICATPECGNIVTRRSKTGMCIPCSASTTLAKVHKSRTPEQYRASIERARESLAERRRCEAHLAAPSLPTRPTLVLCRCCGESIAVGPSGKIPRRCRPEPGVGYRSCFSRRDARASGER